jgi:hypothetical protein
MVRIGLYSIPSSSFSKNPEERTYRLSAVWDTEANEWDPDSDGFATAEIDDEEMANADEEGVKDIFRETFGSRRTAVYREDEVPGEIEVPDHMKGPGEVEGPAEG